MKRYNISAKWLIFAHLAAFALILFVVLWILQSAFFIDHYQKMRIEKMKNVATGLIQSIEHKKNNEAAEKLCKDNLCWARVFTEAGEEVYASDSSWGPLNELSDSEIHEIYLLADSQGGGFIRFFDFCKDGELLTTNSPNVKNERKQMEALYALTFRQPDGAGILVLLYSMVSPTPDTVKLLQIGLVIALGLMLVFSFIVCIIMARKILRPIANINMLIKKRCAQEEDITFKGGAYREIVELNDTPNKTYQEMARAIQLRQDVIADISHELRAPLTMIVGYAEMMRDLPGENTPDNLQTIIEEAIRLSDIVNDVLDLSRLKEGRVSLNKVTFNLTKTIQTKLDHGIKFVWNAGYNIRFVNEEHVWVTADEGKILQVLYNLVGNAVNHTGDDKSVVVRQIVLEDQIRIEVTDTGRGIEPERIPLIWERWSDHQSAQERNFSQGAGLGLAIVKSILDLHGSKYGVVSSVGRGSTFWFELGREK